MAWTYTASPGTVPLDRVRFEIGDTNSASPLLVDAEIQFLLDRNNGFALAAAAEACYAIAAKLATQVDVSVGKLSVRASQRAEWYTARAKQLATLAGGHKVRIYVGGRSWSERIAPHQDPDRIEPAFETGKGDLYGPHYGGGYSQNPLILYGWGRYR